MSNDNIMQRLLKSYSFFLLLLVLSSCDLEETNINPNDPLDVPVELLLPPALEAATGEMAEDAAVYAGIFSQYFTGVDNQALPVERYLLDESFNMNPLWQDFYNTPLSTFDQIIQQAEAADAPHYVGVAKIMQAFTIGTVTSLWGDVPFSTAFSGSDNLNPGYDQQDDIYVAIQRLLDEGINDLSEAESVFSPGADDVIYNGDLGQWIKAAYAFKARFLMHIIKQRPEAASLALEAIEQAFLSSEDDLIFTFGFNEAEQNPWYIYFQNTPYVEVDDYFVDLLDGQEDPRKSQLIKRSFGVNRVGPYLADEFAPIRVISYVEMKFLEAEARLRSGEGDAEASLQDAMREHLLLATTDEITADSIEQFISLHASLSGDFENDLEAIITQKYISQFTHIESWTDYRRTGYPVLPVNADGEHPQNPGGDIPRRFIYPQNERLFNTNFPESNPNLQDRFWWDEE